MSVQHYAGRIELACDGCGCGVVRAAGAEQRGGRTYAKDDFKIMIEDAKAAGWSITKEESVWRHYCGDCAAERPPQGGRQLF